MAPIPESQPKEMSQEELLTSMEQTASTTVADLRDILNSIKKDRAPKSVDPHNTEELSVKSDITQQEQEQEKGWRNGKLQE